MLGQVVKVVGVRVDALVGLERVRHGMLRGGVRAFTPLIEDGFGPLARWDSGLVTE
jgi:hypothetical protein